MTTDAHLKMKVAADVAHVPAASLRNQITAEVEVVPAAGLRNRPALLTNPTIMPVAAPPMNLIVLPAERQATNLLRVTTLVAMTTALALMAPGQATKVSGETTLVAMTTALALMVARQAMKVPRVTTLVDITIALALMAAGQATKAPRNKTSAISIDLAMKEAMYKQRKFKNLTRRINHSLETTSAPLDMKPNSALLAMEVSSAPLLMDAINSVLLTTPVASPHKEKMTLAVSMVAEVVIFRNVHLLQGTVSRFLLATARKKLLRSRRLQIFRHIVMALVAPLNSAVENLILFNRRVLFMVATETKLSKVAHLATVLAHLHMQAVANKAAHLVTVLALLIMVPVANRVAHLVTVLAPLVTDLVANKAVHLAMVLALLVMVLVANKVVHLVMAREKSKAFHPVMAIAHLVMATGLNRANHLDMVLALQVMLTEKCRDALHQATAARISMAVVNTSVKPHKANTPTKDSNQFTESSRSSRQVHSTTDGE